MFLPNYHEAIACKLTWLQATAIGDTRVWLAVASQVTAGASKLVLFYLPESSDAFPLEILVSISLDLS